MTQVYHNPRCGKSRNCLAFLEDNAIDFEVIKYLENPPTEKELTALLAKLNLSPMDIVRQKEKLWIENFKNKSFTTEELITILSSNPILIERPIVIRDNKAIIARDLEKIKDFIK
ncbi:arsenate reductase (glutaredoxin) [Flavobacterium faecale]|uniref:Arsenate reductase (Glutaredoxin) n=1 Tax=Flavobacterium faecale TaxID=1355330 RepID=A0A2S1LFT2_9FLAO|nr:arsenate reductase (glutaredoxin) [Flavobacterium faecale]AWG22614.1 arsenate reductase (glutaredoxin) [Flavobacterium faecale]